MSMIDYIYTRTSSSACLSVLLACLALVPIQQSSRRCSNPFLDSDTQPPCPIWHFRSQIQIAASPFVPAVRHISCPRHPPPTPPALPLHVPCLELTALPRLSRLSFFFQRRAQLPSFLSLSLSPLAGLSDLSLPDTVTADSSPSLRPRPCPVLPRHYLILFFPPYDRPFSSHRHCGDTPHHPNPYRY